MEVWKDIVGYEGLYQVSNYGRVKSLNYRHKAGKQKVLKKQMACGYHQVKLYKDGEERWCKVHRLVAEAFVDGYEVGLVVNHKNEMKTDNRSSNLEWMTQRENTISSSKHPNPVKAVRCVELDDVYDSTREASRQTGCDQSSISKCCRGILKTCGGYHWEFI